jgi:hypothetical protein
MANAVKLAAASVPEAADAAFLRQQSDRVEVLTREHDEALLAWSRASELERTSPSTVNAAKLVDALQAFEKANTALMAALRVFHHAWKTAQERR